MPNDEKTESATPKRREDERKKGNIPKTQDFTSALMLSVSIGLVIAMAPKIMADMERVMYYAFSDFNVAIVDTKDLMGFLAPYAQATGIIVVPFLVLLMVLALIVVRMQVGFVFAAERIKPTLDRLKPPAILQGLRRIFNPFETKNLVELTKNILKVLVVGSCGYSVINSRKEELFALIGMDAQTSLAVLGSILVNMLINMCAVMLILGFLDKQYQDYEYEKSIKMTKQEIKDEYKNVEGDPKIKARIRSTQMKMMRQKMMAQVPKADVVVTNPTHYAVAIKYDRKVSSAPIIVAKGVDYLAFKIKEIAQENKIPIVENKPLARSLYKLVPVDGVIPADLYVAVAEVLAYVYNRNKTGVN